MGKARQAFERAIEIRETIVRDFPDKAAYRRGLMVNYANLADTINDVRFAPKPDPEGTRPYYQKVVAIAQSLAAADPKNHMAQMDLAQSFFRMGCLEEATSHMSAAVGQYRQALAITRAAAGVPDAARSTLILHVSVLQRLGKVLISQGQVREAVDGYGNAFQVVKGLARREPGSTEILGRVVASSGVLAGGLGQAGSRDALDDLARKIEPEIERAGRSTLPPLMRPYPAIAMLRFGEAYTLLHDKPSACKWLQRSAGAWTQVESNGGITPDREPLHASTLRLLASCTAAPGLVERPSKTNQDHVSDLSQSSRNSK
ncbi:MAG: hypothetical protein HY013_21980 [Candidatus Solibacter usitatus]|nr:hypothetical protein [Candidatus Solibacter usitatus]